MKNAHLRFGWLTYVKSMEKTTTSIKLPLDRFIGEVLPDSAPAGESSSHISYVELKSSVGVVAVSPISSARSVEPKQTKNQIKASMETDVQDSLRAYCRYRGSLLLVSVLHSLSR